MSRLYDAYHEAAFQAPEVLTPERLSQGIEKYRGYEPFLPGDRDASILDIGCGVGYFLHFLKSRGYSKIQGIDLSPQMIGICKANFPGAHAEVVDAFDHLLFHKENFDAIVANDVLEHVPKDRTVDLMAAIHSALKMGGAFLAKVPNLGNPFAIRLRYTDFTHEVGFTEQSLRQVLWLGGVRTIRVLPFPLVHPLTLKSMLEGIISRFIFLWITKMMQYQGFVAPRILTPLIFVQAVKDRDAG